MLFDTLCLSSGGIHGLSYIGSLDYLVEEKIIYLNKIKNYVGTSIGSIILFFIIINYTIKEINQLMINLNFNKLESEIKIENILLNNGVNDGSKIIILLKFFLKKKLNIDDITFKELYTKYNKNFIIIGTNYTKGEEAIFNHINTPDMSIITAIRISISIPIIFTPVLYDNEYYIDGALTNRFPINHCNQETTISINIPYPKTFKIDNIIDILVNSVKIMAKTSCCKNEYEFCDNIINIFCDEINPFDLNVTLETKIKLINIGRETIINHIDKSKKLINIICKNILNDIIDNIKVH
jgi:NTE family protein